MPVTNADTSSPTRSARTTSILRRIARRVRRRSAVANSALEDIAVLEASRQFDKNWYLQQNPDVAASGVDPIEHYVRHGAAEGRDPNRKFSTTSYLRNNPDVAASGMNPFRHYVQHGLKEGRIGSSVPAAADKTTGSSSAGSRRRKAVRRPVQDQRSDNQVITQSGVFDSAYYRATYPDVTSTGMAPVDHYLKVGAAEGRNPCAFFDTRYYLESNPDVARSGMNPLVHFCRHGFGELRNPSADFDLAWYWLTYLADDLATNPLAHYLSTGLREGLERRAVDSLTAEDKQALTATCQRLLLDATTRDHECYTRLGIILTRLSCRSDAEEAFRRALVIDWDDAPMHARLAAVLAKEGKWWQAVESWSTAIELDAGRASWFFHLGEAQEKMSRYVRAADAYQKAIALDPDHPDWYYLLGYVREKAGQSDSAVAAYDEAIARDPREDVKAFGIGVFHQARGYWPEAADAYVHELDKQPACAELHFKVGFAHDRCYRWPEAERAYRNAIALKLDTAYWHYRHGFVLERQERFSEAAKAYAAAATFSARLMPYWWYRCGYAWAAAGEHEAACRAYLQTRERQNLSGGPSEVPEGDGIDGRQSPWLDDYLGGFPSEKLLAKALAYDATHAEPHYQLGEARERRGDWTGAAAAYADAVARSNPHRPAWYYRLGFVLTKAGRFAEACAAFRETRILRRPFGVDSKRYEEDVSVKDGMEYNEYAKTLDIRPRTILYESYHGASLSCNPFAIFKYLLEQSGFSDWTHVWSVDDKCSIPSEYRAIRNVIFVRRGSDLYRRYLASASHLINNNTFMPSFLRRPGQQYLNTWHGTPIKGLGKDIRDEFMAHKNAARNLLMATHVLSPNKHTSDVLICRNDIAGIFTGKIAEVGHPRVDRLINATAESKAELRVALGIPADAKVVLYAPTWRGTVGDIRVDVEGLTEDLRIMAEGDHHLLFKGHHLLERALGELDLPVTVVTGDVDTCELLSIVDVLVTDYSSIWVDFLPTGRPILYYWYDWEQYTKDRSLYLDIGSMPGHTCRTRESLAGALRRELGRPISNGAAYEYAIKRFCPREDGCATERAVRFFFNGDESCEVGNRYTDDRISLLMYAGAFIPNGITNSCVNLLNALDHSRYRACIAIDVASITKDTSRLKKFRELAGPVQVLARSGIPNWSPEERWVAERFGSRHSFYSESMREVYREAYQAEAKRTFGYANVDMVVQFDGYVNFWSSILAFWPDDSTARAIYLHNDMRGEVETRFPFLRGTFALYPDYDCLISVSSSVNAKNRGHLSSLLPVSKDAFAYCDNVLNPATIIAKSNEELDSGLREWFGGATVIGTLGRLSPEKGHSKLVRAFDLLKKRLNSSTTAVSFKLVIAGDGPLRGALQSQVDELGLGDDVRLLGQLANPYPLLRRLDLFVLSSDYEGQGIVVLEALTLGKPVVSTDVVGPRTILEGGFGLLVENNVESLATGMCAMLDGKVAVRRFDAEEYQSSALKQFTDIVDRAIESRSRRGRRTGIVDKTNRIVVAARQDGLGERLNAILNGMFLAHQLGFEFAYHWPPTSSAERLGVDKALHAIGGEEEFFSSDFIARYSIPDFNSKGFVEVRGKGLTREHLVRKTEDPDFAGWLAPRLDLDDLLVEQLRPNPDFNLGSVFNEIEFHETVAAAIRAARSLDIPAHCVGVHLRSGDIFYGAYRKLVHYTYKGVTLPIAKAIISSIAQSGGRVLLFGQDRDVLQYLKKVTGAMTMEDLHAPKFVSSTVQAMFEIVLMSRCERIVAGSSGFAKQASWIAGIRVEHPADFFSPGEQTRISIEDLDENADRYHPLQTSFAYWYGYFCGRHAKSFDEADMLLRKAYQYDPENQLYPLKRAANCFRNGKFDEGDAILAQLLKSEFMEVRSPKLPAFRILTAKTLGQFNLVEDFEAFSRATEEGYPHAAACDYVIRSVTKQGTAPALRVLKGHRIGNGLMRTLYDHWAKTNPAQR